MAELKYEPGSPAPEPAFWRVPHSLIGWETVCKGPGTMARLEVKTFTSSDLAGRLTSLDLCLFICQMATVIVLISKGFLP